MLKIDIIKAAVMLLSFFLKLKIFPAVTMYLCAFHVFIMRNDIKSDKEWSLNDINKAP